MAAIRCLETLEIMLCMCSCFFSANELLLAPKQVSTLLVPDSRWLRSSFAVPSAC
jgi:hypothetical protein